MSKIPLFSSLFLTLSTLIAPLPCNADIHLDADEICQSLENQYYAIIPFDVSRDLVDDTVEAFLTFLEMDAEVKNHLHSLLPGIHRRRDLGYTHRQAVDPTEDDTKDFFHYHPHMWKEHRDYIAENPVLSQFITKIDAVWHLADDAAKKVLAALDSKFPNVYDGVFDTEEPHIVLRLVYYQAHPQQEILARPHFDAGSFTLAIAESAPGLRIGSKQEDLALVPYDKNGMIFMLGANCSRMVPHEKLLPSWHDVIRLDDLTTRWALVAFIDGHSVESPSLRDTHQKDQKERTGD